VFRQLRPEQAGVRALSRRLTSLLVSRIQQQLQPMKTAVDRLLGEVRTELRQLGGVAGGRGSVSSTADRQKMLVALTQDVRRIYSNRQND
jgi:interferon-induced GTP-binding protein Mx